MIFAKGLSVPEGPAVLPDGSWLVVEMSADTGCVTHLSADGKERRVIAKTGRPNGVAVDKNGVIWVAESLNRSLVRLTMDGQTETVLTECDGEPFLFPNDLCFGPDGKLYMTDSGVLFDEFVIDGKVRADYMDVPYDGRVYRIDLDTLAIDKIDSGIKFTNGIAFSPNDDLYSNETITGMVYRYRWNDGEVGKREDFGNVIAPDAPEGIKGPDGMCFGEDGKLYVTVFGQKDVTVLGKDGAVVERIKTAGSMPTNVAFGLPGDKRIYVTEDELGQLEVFEVETDGLPLYS